jgi:hypothetical protein
LQTQARRHQIAESHSEKGKRMNQYRKPVMVDLGSVKEVIRGTLIKGHRGIIETIHWKMIPAYDLDD